MGPAVLVLYEIHGGAGVLMKVVGGGQSVLSGSQNCNVVCRA